MYLVNINYALHLENDNVYVFGIKYYKHFYNQTLKNQVIFYNLSA